MKQVKTKSARFDLTRVDTQHFLEVMEVENLKEATEEEFNFSCPFPGHAHGDTSPSAYMNVETTAWMCHGCKRRGNAITFLAEIESVSLQKARFYLQRQYGLASPDPDEYSIGAELRRFYAKIERERSAPEFDVFLPDEVNMEFLIDWSRASEANDIPPELAYMFDRGFDPIVLEEWEIGYDDDRERITIPVRNHEGKLVGFKGRAWNNRKPKYLVMGGEKYDYPRYHKSRIVFGLDKALDYYKSVEGDVFKAIPELIICEGELDVISLHEKGFVNAVCVAGSEFSETQERLIRRFADSAVIFFDSDEGGHTGTLLVMEALRPYMPVRVVPEHDGDPNEMTTEEIQSCLDESESITKIRLMTTGDQHG